MTYFMAGEGRRQYGQTVPSELRDKFAMSIRQPVGVSAIITPWNFPMAIPSWKIIPALVCGNTVVFKPATLTPLSALNFVKILEEAGIPRGVVNLVTGGGGDVGNALLVSDAVRIVSFTGSTEVGRTVSGAGRAVVQESAPRDGRQERHHDHGRRATWSWRWKAACGAASGPAASAAPRRAASSSTRRSTEPFLEQFVARARALRVGDGLDPTTQMGPSVSQRPARDRDEVRRDRAAGRRAARLRRARARRAAPTPAASSTSRRSSRTWRRRCGSRRKRSSGRSCR